MRYTTFALFFFVQTLSRGLLLSVIPLQALDLMGNAQSASVLLFAASASGIVAALAMPAVVKAAGVYRTFLIASGVMAVSLLALASRDEWMFGVGLFLHVFAIAAAEVTLSLYVLALIPRRELLRFEPWRMLFSVLALTVGPFLGVWFKQEIDHMAPFAIGVLAVAGTLIYFHILGLNRIEEKRSTSAHANPLTHIGRFFSQPRLRLAYGLITARSAWWAMFVIYVPIYAKQTGLGELTGAAIVSIGTAWTLSVPFWGWIGRRFGLRRLLIGGFLATGIMSLLAFEFAGSPVLVSYILVMCALGASMLDGAGNVLFFRAVHARERSAMTAVFATYRDTGQLATPGVCAVLLKFFALPAVFAAAGVWMFISAWYCRYIPRSMR